MKQRMRRAYSDVLESFIKCYFEVIFYANVNIIFEVTNINDKKYKRKSMIIHLISILLHGEKIVIQSDTQVSNEY